MEYLATGHAQGRSSAAGPMGEAVDDSLRFLVSDDIRAMVAYLKSVPPISDNTNPAAVRSPPAEAQVTWAELAAGSDHGLGLRTFEGACLGCHSFDGSGAVWPHASLAGSRSVNDPAAVNVKQMLFQGARLHSPDGPVFMPTFGDGYTNIEIAAVANYVTGRFGASASSITPDEVSKRRRGD